MQLSLPNTKIDQKQTKANSRAVLKQFRRWQRIADKSTVDLKSPIITDIPKAASNPTDMHDTLNNVLDARAMRDEVVEALAKMSFINRLILFYSYCDVNYHSNTKIAKTINYSDKTIELKKGIALIEFAEAYKSGVLVVYAN